MHRIQLILEEDLPVIVLNNTKAAIHDFHVTVGGSIAHVVERATPITKPPIKTWSRFGKTRKNKAAIGTDASGAFHVRCGIAFAKPRLFIAVRCGLCGQLAVEAELPSVIRAGEQAARVSLPFIAEHGPPMGASIVQDVDLALRTPHHKH